MEGKYDDKYVHDDDFGDKKSCKHGSISSPRKKLMQAKRNADAIETENTKVEAHRTTKNVSRSFVHDIISDCVCSLAEEKHYRK